jgi:hypothetical protein
VLRDLDGLILQNLAGIAGDELVLEAGHFVCVFEKEVPFKTGRTPLQFF